MLFAQKVHIAAFPQSDQTRGCALHNRAPLCTAEKKGKKKVAYFSCFINFKRGKKNYHTTPLKRCIIIIFFEK